MATAELQAIAALKAEALLPRSDRQRFSVNLACRTLRQPMVVAHVPDIQIITLIRDAAASARAAIHRL